VTDINDLKYINDFYGHHTGDDVIIKFSEILKKYCKDDLVFRVGGDEFIIILKRCNNGNLENLIEQIKNECNNTIINMERENITIVASFGYEIRYSKDDNINEVIKIADKNMYIDKDNYKNNKRRRHIYDKLLYANKNNLGR
jgi:diguanylate cyclase (GGDEF)-like protein